MKRIQKTLKNWIDADKKTFIRTFLLSGGFGFCLCLSFVWGYWLDERGSVSDDLAVTILLALAAGLACAVLLTCFWAYERDARSNHDEAVRPVPVAPAFSIKIWIISSMVMLACWIPVWLAYYPVIFAYDANTQLAQVISGGYSTHHPLLHTLWMGACMKLMYDRGGMNAGMALYAASQMLLMSVMLGWTVAEAARSCCCCRRRLGILAYAVFLAVFPVHAMLSVSATKDVVFAGFVMVCVMLIRRRDLPDLSKKAMMRTSIGIVASCTLMIAFRNNASYALALTILIMIASSLAGRRPVIRDGLIVSLVIGLAAGLIFTGGLKGILHAEPGSPREALSVPIQQISRVMALHGDELDAGLIEDVGVIMPDGAYERYDEHLSDPVKRLMNMKSPGTFVRAWVKLGLKYPGTYLDAWLFLTEGAWYVRDVSVSEIYGTGGGFGYLNTDVRPMPEGFEVTPAPVFPGLRNVLEHLTTDNAFLQVPVIRLIFAPATYVWALIAYLYVGTVKRRTKALRPCTLLLALLVTILFGPAMLVRYMYPYMLAPLLMIMGFDYDCA